MIKAWEAFLSSGGDVGYFRDFNLGSRSSHLIGSTVGAIQEKLGTLKSLEQRLYLLKELSLTSADAVSLTQYPSTLSVYRVGIVVLINVDHPPLNS